MAAFEPARALYRRFGFVETGPFEDYRPDPNSIFMSRDLPVRRI
jgi:putative acetyltransferase